MIHKISYTTGLKDMFPAISIALSIIFILPLSNATTKRAFSNLKLINTRLRNTMLEDWMALMIMSCEKDIPINNDDVIHIFLSYNTILIKLLI